MLQYNLSPQQMQDKSKYIFQAVFCIDYLLARMRKPEVIRG